MSAIFINILVGFVVLAGIGLTLINLPGNSVIFVVALVYGIYDGFTNMTVQTLLLIFALFIAGELVEFIAGALGAKKQKASTRAVIAAIIGAILGGVIGTGILPLIGSVLGAMGGAFAASYIAEYTKAGDADHARRVGVSVMKGQAIGMIVKILMAAGMAALVIAKLLV